MYILCAVDALVDPVSAGSGSRHFSTDRGSAILNVDPICGEIELLQMCG